MSSSSVLLPHVKLVDFKMPPLMKYQRTSQITEGHKSGSGITAVAFSPDGQHLATAGLDYSVCIWRVSDNSLLHTLSGRSSTLCITWLPSRKHSLLCGMQDGCVTVLTFGDVCTPPPIISQAYEPCSENHKCYRSTWPQRASGTTGGERQPARVGGAS